MEHTRTHSSSFGGIMVTGCKCVCERCFNKIQWCVRWCDSDIICPELTNTERRKWQIQDEKATSHYIIFVQHILFVIKINDAKNMLLCSLIFNISNLFIHTLHGMIRVIRMIR